MSVNRWRRVIVDRISMLGKIVDPDLYNQSKNQLYAILKNKAQLLPGGRVWIKQEEYSTRLDWYPVYSSTNKDMTRRIASITLGSNILFGTGKLYRFFKLDLYPSQFQGEEFKYFQLVLEKYLPTFRYPSLHQSSKVNHLELAVDSLTHLNHTFLPATKYSKVSDIYKEANGCKGSIYIGDRETSDHFFRIYDKKRQLISKGKAPMYAKSPHTRFEHVRVRRIGVTPSGLATIKNPFAKLLIFDLKMARAVCKSDEWQNFISTCLDQGIAKTMVTIPEKRKTYWALLKGCHAKWWDPDYVFSDLQRALEKIAPEPVTNSTAFD